MFQAPQPLRYHLSASSPITYICKHTHQNKKNPPEIGSSSEQKHSSFVNLSLSDDTFDTFASFVVASSFWICGLSRHMLPEQLYLLFCVLPSFCIFIFCRLLMVLCLWTKSLENGCKTLFYGAAKYVYSKHKSKLWIVYVDAVSLLALYREGWKKQISMTANKDLFLSAQSRLLFSSSMFTVFT